jgi:hypothetical protein
MEGVSVERGQKYLVILEKKKMKMGLKLSGIALKYSNCN